MKKGKVAYEERSSSRQRGVSRTTIPEGGKKGQIRNGGIAGHPAFPQDFSGKGTPEKMACHEI